MPIKRLTPPADIDRLIEKEVEKRKSMLVRELCIIGEKVLNTARLDGEYVDQTGNLRSSVGYVVVFDGKIVQMSSFEVVKEGVEGSKAGKDYALSIVNSFPKGIALIVVAGMEYASYVSSKVNVLESAELLAEKLVPQMLKELGIK